MKRSEGIAFLTRCANENGEHWSGGVKWDAAECPTCHGTNDAGWLHTPCSRYGRDADECAPAAWRVASLIARESGEPVTEALLDSVMSQVVNDSDEPAYIVRQYGHRHW